MKSYSNRLTRRTLPRCAGLINVNLKSTMMKNKNKFDAMLNVIESGDTKSLEQQNALHLSQMKTLLDDHLTQQQGILAEFTEGGKVNIAEMKKWREEMTREGKVPPKGRKNGQNNVFLFIVIVFLMVIWVYSHQKEYKSNEKRPPFRTFLRANAPFFAKKRRSSILPWMTTL